MSPFCGTHKVRRAPCIGQWGRSVFSELDLTNIWLLIIILILTTTCCQGLPVKSTWSSSAISKAVEFMSKYGYLPPSDPNTAYLRTESQLREAIASMQHYGHIKPTGVLDDATLALMQRRRCGLPDIIRGDRTRRYAIQGQRWTTTNLTWSVKSTDPASDLRMVRTQLNHAFSVWSAASSLHFMEVKGPRADIMVSFLKGPHGDGYPFDGEGAVLAHAFFPGEGIGGDAHFDAEEKWLSSQPPDEDDGVHLFAVAAHEIGHSLGLSHSSAPGSLMFPYYQVVGENFLLPKDDADGIRHLYGMKDLENQSTMPPLDPTTDVSITTFLIPTTKKIRQSTKKTILPTKKPIIQSTTPRPPVPDVCNTTIDAISIIRRELFIFKGTYFWRLHLNRTLKTGYPVFINRFWSDLPQDIEKIDALYERPIDTKIVFFTGKRYWLFSGNQLEPGYPRPLTDLGLPSNLERVDAAMVWGHNGRSYFFSGKEYWKFDEEEERVELDYPRNIIAWRGLPTHIDAAFQWTDGNIYLFKGTKFWKFLDSKMKIESKGPHEIGAFWFNCNDGEDNPATQSATLWTDSTVNTSTINSAMDNQMLNTFTFFLICGIGVFNRIFFNL